MWRFVQMNPSVGCWVCFIICMMVNSSFLCCQAAKISLGAITPPSVSARLTALIWYKWPLAVLSLVCAASVSPQLEVYDDSGKTWREIVEVQTESLSRAKGASMLFPAVMSEFLLLLVSPPLICNSRTHRKLTHIHRLTCLVNSGEKAYF